MRAWIRFCAFAAVAALAVTAVPARAADLAGQIKTLTEGMQDALDTNQPTWGEDQRKMYVDAFRSAFEDFLAEPMKEADLEIALTGLTGWTKRNLPNQMSPNSLNDHFEGIKYVVEQLAGRKTIRPTEAEQKKIDHQIDIFCNYLKPTLIKYFKQRSGEKALIEVTEAIRQGLKYDSRNPWVPVLKETLDKKEESEIKSKIVEETMITQAKNFKQAEAEGRKFTFDWGVTSAWSAATKFVSQSIKPPTDRMLMFTHAPGMPSIGIQVRPPMGAPEDPPKPVIRSD